MLRITISGKTTTELHEQILDLYKATFQKNNAVTLTESWVKEATDPKTQEVVENTLASEPKAAEPVTVKTVVATKADVNTALNRVVQKFGAEGMSRAVAIITSFGGKKLADIPVEKYSEVIEACEKAL